MSASLQFSAKIRAILAPVDLLEMFIHSGCLSEDAASLLLLEVTAMSPDLHVEVRLLPQAQDRAEAVGIVVTPAFVLNGEVIAVGVPKKEWLVAKLNSARFDYR